MIITLRRVGIEGMYLNIIKAIYDKPTGTVILRVKNAANFSSKIRSKTGLLIFPTVIQLCIGSTQPQQLGNKKKERHMN